MSYISPPKISRRAAARLIALPAARWLMDACSVFGEPSPTAAISVNWQTLKTLTSATAQNVPARQLDGKRVAIPGFMVPLEDDAEKVTEFLLVPYAGACIHVPPPPPNQMVHVLVARGGKVPVSFTDPIVVTGTLRISTVPSPYGSVSYDLAAESVTSYTGPS